MASEATRARRAGTEAVGQGLERQPQTVTITEEPGEATEVIIEEVPPDQPEIKVVQQGARDMTVVTMANHRMAEQIRTMTAQTLKELTDTRQVAGELMHTVSADAEALLADFNRFANSISQAIEVNNAIGRHFQKLKELFPGKPVN